jgi:poly(3-hydroxybutyrate) depolymerase
LFFGSTSRDVDATSEMWKFFRDRRLPIPDDRSH